MIRSKFNTGVYFIVVLLVCTTALMIFLIREIYINIQTSIYFIPVLLCVAFVWVFLFFGELRTKAIFISMDNVFIHKRSYLGWGKIQQYTIREFNGFTTSVFNTENGYYEYLYLKKENRKVIKLSQYYHKNYNVLKEHIKDHLKNLGTEPFKLSHEIKESFC